MSILFFYTLATTILKSLLLGTGLAWNNLTWSILIWSKPGIGKENKSLVISWK